MDFFSPAVAYHHHGIRATLAEHLGYSADDRLVIISADDFGLCPEVNAATIELLDDGSITSTSIMPPAHSFADAVDKYRDAGGFCCGVHLTMTSDFEAAPLSPMSDAVQVSSLMNSGLRFPFKNEDFFRRAAPVEAESEAAAQIEKALAAGIDVTHLDSHGGSLQLRHEFAEVYLRLAVRYRLPLRMASAALVAQVGLDAGRLDQAREQGLHFPDNLVYIPLLKFFNREEKELFLFELIRQLPAGVTEFYFHPAYDSGAAQELARSSPDVVDVEEPGLIWKARLIDYELLQSGNFRRALEAKGAIAIGYQPLRELVRSG